MSSESVEPPTPFPFVKFSIEPRNPFPFAKYPYGGDMGKIHYKNFILMICSMCNVKSYLELGVANGETLSLINKHVQFVLGIDIADQRIDKSTRFAEMSTDRFFEHLEKHGYNPSYDCIFIDALHEYEQLKRDFENSLSYLSPYGIIILDDTDPVDQRHTSPEICGDAYKIIDYIRTVHPDLDIVTLPVWEKGMSIVRRKKELRMLPQGGTVIPGEVIVLTAPNRGTYPKYIPGESKDPA